jgi:hypothetical protein
MMQSTDGSNASTTSNAIATASASLSSSAESDEEAEAEESASEEAILACCVEGDITQLRLWTSLGVNVLFSEAPFMKAAKDGQVDVLRYFVRELGADVNQATKTGQTD